MFKIKRYFYIVNFNNKIFGKIIKILSYIIKGKNKIDYKKNFNYGDFFSIVNYEKLFFSGSKFKNKIYYKHTGYLGSLKKYPLKDMFFKKKYNFIKKIISYFLKKNKIKNTYLKNFKYNFKYIDLLLKKNFKILNI